VDTESEWDFKELDTLYDQLSEDAIIKGSARFLACLLGCTDFVRQQLYAYLQHVTDGKPDAELEKCLSAVYTKVAVTSKTLTYPELVNSIETNMPLLSQALRRTGKVAKKDIIENFKVDFFGRQLGIGDVVFVRGGSGTDAVLASRKIRDILQNAGVPSLVYGLEADVGVMPKEDWLGTKALATSVQALTNNGHFVQLAVDVNSMFSIKQDESKKLSKVKKLLREAAKDEYVFIGITRGGDAEFEIVGEGNDIDIKAVQ